MVNAARIDRMLRSARHEQLLDEVLSNGRRLPLAARAILAQDGVVELAAHALALQRLVELTYSIPPGSLQLAQHLTQHLTQFTHADRPTHAIAAVLAVASLYDLASQALSTGTAPPPWLADALDRLYPQVAYDLFDLSMQTATRNPHLRGLIDTPLTSALLLWQIHPRPGLAAALQPVFNTADLAHAAVRLHLWRDHDAGRILALVGPLSAAQRAIKPASLAHPAMTAA